MGACGRWSWAQASSSSPSIDRDGTGVRVRHGAAPGDLLAGPRPGHRLGRRRGARATSWPRSGTAGRMPSWRRASSTGARSRSRRSRRRWPRRGSRCGPWIRRWRHDVRTSGEASGAGPVEIGAGPDPASLAWDAAGLVAGVVQDVADGRVLMVGLAGCRGARGHAAHRRRPLPFPVPRPPLAQGRELREHPPAEDPGGRLRRGRPPAGRGARRSHLSSRDAQLLRRRRGGSPAARSAASPGLAWLESLWATIDGPCRDPRRRARTR